MSEEVQKIYDFCYKMRVKYLELGTKALDEMNVVGMSAMNAQAAGFDQVMAFIEIEREQNDKRR